LQPERTKHFEEKFLKFIIRSKEKRKFEEIASFLETENPLHWDGWEVIKDSNCKRWNIKMYFRFMKRELNVSHLVTLDK